MFKLTCTWIILASMLMLSGQILGAQEEPPASLPAVNMLLLLADSQPSGSGYPAPVPKTGAGPITGYALNPSEDGALQKGVVWPNLRFTNNNNGTVTDNLTGLIWLKDGNCAEFYSGDATGQNNRPWADALSAANNLADPYCGLSDGSTAGQWRLPNLRELQSLIDYGKYNPALPELHPFESNLSSNYWSSTTSASGTFNAWLVVFWGGYVDQDSKLNSWYVRAVRGGQ